jgi:hypothetical protein
MKDEGIIITMKRYTAFILSTAILFFLFCVRIAEDAAALTPLAELTVVSDKSAADFTDVPAAAWVLRGLTRSSEPEASNGITEQTFEPERETTLEEYIKMIVAVMFTKERSRPGPDFDLGGQSYAGIPLCRRRYSSRSDERHRYNARPPRPAAARYDMALLLIAAATYLGEELTQTKGIERAIRDYASIPAEYRAAVCLAYSAGMLNGREGNRFSGQTALKGCEAVQTVVRLFDPSARVSVSIPDVSLYDYAMPVQESEAVEDSFFSDAAFVGNSLCDGFRMYSGLKTGAYFCANSLTVFNLKATATPQSWPKPSAERSI